MGLNLMNKMPKGVTLFIGRTTLKIKKNSPEILMFAGIGGLVGAGYLACRATLKVETLLDEQTEKINTCNNAVEQYTDEQYSQVDYDHDIRIIKLQTAWGFVQLYGPAFTLGLTGIGCILGGHHIMKKRNVALIAAYKVIEESFSAYRKRVVDELGEGRDQHFMYGTDYEEITEKVTDPETGKTKKVKKNEQVLNGQQCSGYARLFCNPDDNPDGDITSQWSPRDNTTGDINLMFARQKLNWMNEKLNAYGHVFLNDVYEELGFEPTKAGQVVGWIKKKGVNVGDDYISFGPMVEALTDEQGRAFTHDQIRYRKGDPILLDFNVAMIWDLI